MTDKLIDLLERQKVLNAKRRNVLDSLYDSGGGLKPELARLAYQEVYLKWYNNEQECLHTASWDNPAVQGKRRQFLLAAEEAKEVYNVACLGEDAGKAYQLVLDEIKQLDMEIDKILSQRRR